MIDNITVKYQISTEMEKAMKVKRFLPILFLLLLLCSCSKKEESDFVLVKGGNFVNTNSSYYGTDMKISDFYIGKYEVSQKEWTEVMGSNPSGFPGDDLPVEMVSWYDCIEYCNKRSELEGFEPYYNIDKDHADPESISEYDDVRWTVTTNPNANGYRLPTDAEWEYAASGGQKSNNYVYSGSNDEEEVAWYWRNAGDEFLEGDWAWISIENNKNRTQTIGSKKANELGLYNMAGNVREWCFDWFSDENFESGLFRCIRGGGWIGDVSCCASSYHGMFEANGVGADSGLRLCRNK